MVWAAGLEPTHWQLRRQRPRVRSQRDHVFEGELFHRLLHERAADSRAGAVLEIVELAHDVSRRAPRDPGYRPEALKVRPVACRALYGLAPSTCRGEALSLLDAAGGNVRDETRPRIAVAELRGILGHLYEAPGEGFLFVPFQYIE